MIEIKIKDVNENIFNLDSTIRLIKNDDDEPYGEILTIRLVEEDGKFEVALEQGYQYKTIADYTFVIEGLKK